jgi:NTP pyrophosphatase (non-canonical NTP hydrolase)
MNYREFETLSEVTEKKFPLGLSIPYSTANQVFDTLKEFANNKELDQLKKDIIYKDHFVNEEDNYVHLKPNYAETLHAVLGLVTEVQEIVQWYLNGATDQVNLLEEISDVHWYFAILTRKYKLDLEDGFDKNIAKLKARYGDKFTNYAALNRDLKIERSILEGK